MEYKRLSNEQLERFPYPNLIAELIESHHSITSLSECMGLGRCKEDDENVLGRLRGEIKFSASESLDLCGFFGAKLDYLFSRSLNTIDGKPFAYHRWYEENQRRKREIRRIKDTEEINKALRKRPELREFVLVAATLSPERLDELRKML